MRIGLGGLIIIGILSLLFKQNFFSLLGDLPAGHDDDGDGAIGTARRPCRPQRRSATSS